MKIKFTFIDKKDYPNELLIEWWGNSIKVMVDTKAEAVKWAERFLFRQKYKVNEMQKAFNKFKKK